MYCLPLVFFAAFLVITTHSASIVKRSPDNKGEPECPGRQPCGWYVYNKSSRNMEFFMNNTCVCAEDKLCLQTDDDLSVGAYVYRCIERKATAASLIPS